MSCLLSLQMPDNTRRDTDFIMFPHGDFVKTMKKRGVCFVFITFWDKYHTFVYCEEENKQKKKRDFIQIHLCERTFLLKTLNGADYKSFKVIHIYSSIKMYLFALLIPAPPSAFASSEICGRIAKTAQLHGACKSGANSLRWMGGGALRLNVVFI